MYVIWMTQVMGQDRQRNPIRQKLGSIVRRFDPRLSRKHAAL
jgi:hypothetical protein